MTKKEQALLAAAIRKVADVALDRDYELRAFVQSIVTDLDLPLGFSFAALGVIDLSGRDYLAKVRQHAEACS